MLFFPLLLDSKKQKFGNQFLPGMHFSEMCETGNICSLRNEFVVISSTTVFIELLNK